MESSSNICLELKAFEDDDKASDPGYFQSTRFYAWCLTCGDKCGWKKMDLNVETLVKRLFRKKNPKDCEYNFFIAKRSVVCLIQYIVEDPQIMK